MFKKMSSEDKKNLLIIAGITSVVCVIVLIGYIQYSNLMNSPEIHEQAVVIDTRVRATGSGNSRFRYYFATFRFSDGTEQEMRIDFSRRDRYGRYRIHRSGAYASINVGDIGIVVFQQKGTDTNFIRFEHSADSN